MSEQVSIFKKELSPLKGISSLSHNLKEITIAFNNKEDLILAIEEIYLEFFGKEEKPIKTFLKKLIKETDLENLKIKFAYPENFDANKLRQINLFVIINSSYRYSYIYEIEY